MKDVVIVCLFVYYRRDFTGIPLDPESEWSGKHSATLLCDFHVQYYQELRDTEVGRGFFQA
jgi:hypothetical protein